MIYTPVQSSRESLTASEDQSLILIEDNNKRAIAEIPDIPPTEARTLYSDWVFGQQPSGMVYP